MAFSKERGPSDWWKLRGRSWLYDDGGTVARPVDFPVQGSFSVKTISQTDTLADLASFPINQQ